jgi:hypothetical protein
MKFPDGKPASGYPDPGTYTHATYSLKIERRWPPEYWPKIKLVRG